MTPVLSIARQEIRERGILLTTAVVFSLLAFLLLVVPGRGRGVGEALALLMFFALPVAAALAVGASLVSRDVAEGRLSFYFSRPLSAWSLGAGKLLGGLALVAAVAFICILPFAFSEGRWSRGPGWSILRLPIHPVGVGFLGLVLVALMAFAHLIATMYRSRSRIFAIDLGLGLSFLTLLALESRRLIASGAGPALFPASPKMAGAGVTLLGVLPLMLAIAIAVMLAAAAAQLVVGRADPRRGHVALSITLWTLAAAALCGFALWASWVLGVRPADVGAAYPLFAAPKGGAIFFKGAASGRAGFSPVFLMNVETGSYARLNPDRVSPAAFDPEGKVAMWVAPVGPWWWMGGAADAPRVRDWRRDNLAVARLGGDAPVVEERPLDLSEPVSQALAVERGGRRVLLSGPSSIVLLEVESGRVVGTTPLSDVVAAEFLANDAVRLYRREAADPRALNFVVVDWRPADGSRVERARVRGGSVMVLLARGGDLSVVATGDRTIRGPFTKLLVDAATGSVRSFDSLSTPGALVLSNGHVALGLGHELRIVTRTGETVASLPIEPDSRVWAIRESGPDELAVGLWAMSLGKRRTLLVDSRTGVLRREEAGLEPAFGFLMDAVQPVPGSLASRLFADLDGSLIALEPDGRRRTIVAGRD